MTKVSTVNLDNLLKVLNLQLINYNDKPDRTEIEKETKAERDEGSYVSSSAPVSSRFDSASCILPPVLFIHLKE